MNYNGLSIPSGDINYYVFNECDYYIKVSYMNGDTYTGQWTGPSVFGVMQYKDGSVYYGNWKDGEYEGEGKFECREYVYNGLYRKGKKHGYGEFARGGYTYRGNWKNDIFDSMGELVGPNGRVMMVTTFNQGELIHYKLLK